MPSVLCFVSDNNKLNARELNESFKAKATTLRITTCNCLSSNTIAGLLTTTYYCLEKQISSPPGIGQTDGIICASVQNNSRLGRLEAGPGTNLTYE